MKLTIIIPVYNGSDFINKSYQSIINQNFDDYELIYVDNNSTDDSVDKINILKAKDSRIKFFTQPKQGEAAARNMGIEKASGEYIYQLDVDDEVFPNVLSKMIAVLDENPNIEAVFGKMVKSNKPISKTDKPVDETHRILVKDPPYWGLQWLTNLSIVVGEAAFMHRKEVFNKIGFYNINLKVGTDTALDIALGMLCRIAFIDMYVYLYYKHEASIMQQSKAQMNRAFMQWPRFVHSHLPFYLDHDVPIAFKTALFKQVFNLAGKQLYYTKGFKNRNVLLKQLNYDIRPLYFPLLIRFFLNLLLLFRSGLLLRLYNYKIVPYVLKYRIKHL